MMRFPHDVFRLILSFKDPTQQVGVKGGIKTDSASAMPLHVNDELDRLGMRYTMVTSCMIEGKL